jgi:hypothetical protein|nr:MAG TPA: ERF superfamily protein [Caudoviricetes sp.]
MEEKTNIYKKLMAVQSELKAPKGQYNKFGGYNYRSCEDILEAVKPLLNKHGLVLVLTDSVSEQGDRFYVRAEARLIDADNGDEIKTNAYAREALTRKGMDDSQVTGSTSSYARKYALNGLFCIDDNKDADTWNNAPQGRSNARNDSPKGNYAKAGRQAEKTASQPAQTKKTPTTVHDYYELTIEWARAHRAIAFIGPLLNEKFHKGKFEELTLPEAQAFYNNLESLVKEAQAKDDEILEKSMA